ncbi:MULTISPECIES: hypothetical protein [Mycobacteroides]|jgi:hypothetical protein|uniref:Uncharacterized protein n=1 Tax=Mycobacteroides chelonae TaxID=1774 RepID=A0A1S1LLH8_MYCCH|nr:MULTISPECIES: hypothetical protein [Mycobacteroides]KRQ22489.1 hypothetical protein AOT91_23675 [Mycobacteroides sp. H092]KRQ24381.1 hypothetical protein AOT87_11145 [Mycobacteroides sp. H003]KRQ40069.1 hypothetical protein AOT92_15795 [Mycobacteroides sp. H101]KRQ46889.1 hypothetical protein AOT88_16490 [Mycobacteroides sp. H063]KRQ58350.1 hypothetical protein AOT94_12515 [Mycobacteroides sp. HXVII]
MSRIPPNIELIVAQQLYTQAIELDWTNLTPQQRSAQYVKWLEDPYVGGKLADYLTPSAARVWIKDGPMKEWTRAVSGVGKYAALVVDTESLPRRIVQKILGSEWQPSAGTLRVKPLRVTLVNGEDEVVLTWAPANGLKHMVWAALKASAEGDVRSWIVCVTDTFTKPTPANEKQAHQQIAERCGLRLVHVTV